MNLKFLSISLIFFFFLMSNDKSSDFHVCVNHSVMSNSLRPHGLYLACQAHLSMGFFREEYWSGLPVLSPGT